MKILIDTSVWIDFFKGINSRENQLLKRLIAERENLFLTPLIIQEILQGIRTDKQYVMIKDCLLLFQIVESLLPIHILAADIYRGLRKNGITVRSPIDCLIAALAIENNLSLLHRDSDFDQIAKHYPLKLVI